MKSLLSRYLCGLAFGIMTMVPVHAGITVSSGGTWSMGNKGMSDLAVTLNSVNYRAGGGLLYIHQIGWAATSSADKGTISSLFPQPPVWEVGAGPNATYPLTAFQSQCGPYWSSAWCCTINGLSGDLVRMQALRDASVGVFNYVAAVDSPNSSTTLSTQHPFSDTYWDGLRAEALIGGAVATDAPPDFYFAMPDAYRQWIADDIKWARANGVVSVVIIFPRDSANFWSDTSRYITDLQNRGARPTHWAVDGYYGDTDPERLVHPIGSETVTSHSMYTALQLVNRENALASDQSPPARLTATAEAYKVTLSWPAATGAASYRVKRTSVPGAIYATVANGTGTSYTDTGLTNGTNYYYVVTAVDATGNESCNSPQSGTVTPSIVGNFGFETPVVSGDQSTPVGAGWTFSGQAGISAAGSVLTAANPTAPQGRQVAFVERTGSFSQKLSGFVPNTTYTLTFSAAQRNNGQVGQTLAVTWDGKVIRTFAPLKYATSYADYSVSFTTTLGSHTLAFVGTDTLGGDNTLFIDNVRLPTPTPTTFSGFYFMLKNRAGGLMLDAFRSGVRSGTLVVQNPALSGSAPQQWALTPDSHGYYVLLNRYNNLALENLNGSVQAASRIDLGTPDGSDNQEWTIANANSGYYTLVNRHSGMALEDYGASTSPGAAVVQNTVGTGSAQQWQITPTD